VSKKIIVLEGPFYSNCLDGKRARMLFEAFDKYSSDEFYVIDTYKGGVEWVSDYTPLDKKIEDKVSETYRWTSSGNTPVIDHHVYVGYPNALNPKSENITLLTEGVISTQPSEKWKIVYTDFYKKVITSSRFAKLGIDIYKNGDSRVDTVPFSHSILIDDVDVDSLDGIVTTKFNFLNSEDMTTESNLAQLVSSFYKAFYDNPDVGLVLNTKIMTNSILDRMATKRRLQRIVSQLKGAKCRMYLVHGDYNTVSSKHIQAYISVNHGSTFDNNIYSAIDSKVPVVCSEFGGNKELVTDENGGVLSCVFPYSLSDVPIQDDNLYGRFSKWAIFNDQNIAESMVDMYNNYQSYVTKADKLYNKIDRDEHLEELYKSIMEA